MANKYLKEKYKLLKDFGITVSPYLESLLEDMYPNEVAIDNYTKGLIHRHLEKFDEK